MIRTYLFLAINLASVACMHVGYSDYSRTRLLVPFPEQEANSWWCAVRRVCTEVNSNTYCTNGNISTSDGTIDTPFFGIGRQRMEFSYHFVDDLVKYSYVFNITALSSLPSYTGRITMIPHSTPCTNSMDCNSYTIYDASLRMYLAPIGIVSPELASVVLYINNEPFEGLVLRPWSEFCANISFEVQFNTEYLTYFITAQASLSNGEVTYPTTRYFDSVPPPSSLRNTNPSKERLRYFSKEWQSLVLPLEMSRNHSSPGTRNICLYFDESIDGMKQKMLNVIKFLPATTFRWSFFACPSTTGATSIVPYLREISNVEVYACIPGVILSPTDSTTQPTSGEMLSLEDYISQHATSDSTYLSMAYQYAFWRLQQASYIVDQISPSWAKQIWIQLLETLRQPPSPCEMLVFGNDRTPMSTLFTAAAKLLHIPSVMELPNLFPHWLVRPDYVISDSAFGLYHSSLAYLFDTSSGKHTEGVIISPGVDVLHTQVRAVSRPYTCPRGCTIIPSDDILFTQSGRVKLRCGDCFVIGMICRMAKEKSVGLFLQAAAIIAQKCPLCRFVVAGDGPLRAQLELLAEELGIGDQIHFIGWVTKDDIPVMQAGWDVIVNTGAWREIFNGANLDALSIALPLVTFASGGVGEYVADPAFTDQSLVEAYLNDTDMLFSKTPFALSSNAVIIQDTTAEALAAGILFLRDHNDVRSSVGYSGMKTAEKYFQISRTMQAYQNVYDKILS